MPQTGKQNTIFLFWYLRIILIKKTLLLGWQIGYRNPIKNGEKPKAIIAGI